VFLLLSFFYYCFLFGFPYLIYHLILLGFLWYSNYTGLTGKVVSWGFVAVPFEHGRRSIKAQLPVAFFSFLFFFLLGFKVYIIHAPLTAELALAKFYCLPELIFVISSQNNSLCQLTVSDYLHGGFCKYISCKEIFIK